MAHILGISAYTKPPPATEPSDGPSKEPHVHTADCHHDHDQEPKSTHYELRGISSLQVTCPVLKQPQFDRLDEWLRSVLWENRIPEDASTASSEKGESPGLQVLRCKGSFTLEDGTHYVLQGVRNMYEISELDKSSSQRDLGLPDVGKVVLIGKGLDDTVRQSLEKVFQ